MAKITYEDKVALNENPEIALINKVTDDDLNEIKSVVNTNDDNVGVLTNLTTTDKTSAVNAINELNSDKAPDDIILVQSSEPTSDSNILWINDGQIGTPASEITNSYSTSTGKGYSANYVNHINTYSNTETQIGYWFDKPLYRKILTLPTLANNGETNVSYDSTYLIKRFEIYCENPAIAKISLNIPTNNYISSYIDYTNHRIAVQTSSDRTAFTENYAIIEYTKTTD